VIAVTSKTVPTKIHGYITWLALVVAAALAVGLVSMVTLLPQNAKAAEAPPAFITKWGNSTDGDGQFSNPQGVAIDSSGNVYVADTWNHRIQKFNSSGGFMSKWGSLGSSDGQFSNPQGMAVDAQGNVYVADRNNNRIQKFNASGGFITKWGSPGSGDGQFISPLGVAIDSSGNVYVADSGNNCIQKFGDTTTETEDS
jgi:sugar lactone lactonase YvrE